MRLFEVAAHSGWPLIRGGRLFEVGRLFGVGGYSRLSAYLNKYGMYVISVIAGLNCVTLMSLSESWVTRATRFINCMISMEPLSCRMDLSFSFSMPIAMRNKIWQGSWWQSKHTA